MFMQNFLNFNVHVGISLRLFIFHLSRKQKAFITRRTSQTYTLSSSRLFSFILYYYFFTMYLHHEIITSSLIITLDSYE